MTSDPLEERNIAATPEIVARMRREYEAWFKDVTSGRNYTDAGVARVLIGAPQENPVRLTRQDWRGPQAGWTPQRVGHWQVEVARAGDYAITLRFPRLTQPGVISVSVGSVKLEKDVPAGDTTAFFDRVRLARGAATLASHVTQGDRKIGMLDVLVARRR